MKQYTVKEYGGRGCIDPRIFYLSTSLWLVISFTLRQLYPKGKRAPPPRHGQEAGWAPKPVWTSWWDEKQFPYRDFKSEPWTIQISSVTIPELCNVWLITGLSSWDTDLTYPSKFELKDKMWLDKWNVALTPRLRLQKPKGRSIVAFTCVHIYTYVHNVFINVHIISAADCFHMVRRQERDADHLLPSSPYVKNGRAMSPLPIVPSSCGA
jgi:hypothetical protein